MNKINNESFDDKRDSSMEMRKNISSKSNAYKKAKNSDVLASIKKCTKKYDKALKNLAK